jgi:TatD DNase family protein
MPTLLVDTHAHLDAGPFRTDLDAVMARAVANGVSTILTVGCDLVSSRASVEHGRALPEQVYASVGIHPHDAASADAARRSRNCAAGRKRQGGRHRRDRPRLLPRPGSPRDLQRQSFRAQIQLARQLGKPLIVHDRDAHDEVVAILREEGASEVGGVMHCFSGDLAMARACIELGFYISFPGSITYPKNEAAREVVRALPIDQMLVETDCPYLAPQAFRGRRNEPAHVRHTAEAIAAIKGLEHR